MAKAINSNAEFYDAIGCGQLVVADFWASWCGPCKMFAPFFEQLAAKHPDVVFIKVQQDGTGAEVCQEQAIGAYPTIRFYIDSAVKGEVKGADAGKVDSMVNELKSQAKTVVNAFAGSGNSLGGGAAAELTPEQARAARLARFGGGVAAPSPASTSPYGAGGGAGAANPPPAADPMDEDAEMQKALAMSMAMANEGKTDGGDAMAAEPTGASEGAASASASAGADAMDVEGKEGEGKDAGGAEEPNMVLPPVDTAMMNEVVAMGFPEVRVRKALMAGSSNAEAVINWCVEHGEDGDIDDPIPLVAEASGTVGGGGGGGDGTVKSYKCNETGRLFACMADVELYAEKTGRSDFSECTEEKKPRTAEELARDKARLKERIAQKRRERDVEEKEVNKDLEKQRRFMGKEMSKTREQMESEKRARDFRAMKKEKEDAKRERDRLRAELAKDKAERKARGGKLAGRLAAEGYNPAGLSASMAQEDAKAHAAEAAELAAKAVAAGGGNSSATKNDTSFASVEERAEAVDKCIESLMKYKVGGDGGNALKVLNAYTKNLSQKPEEDKFRTIKLDNNAYKSKVATLRGGTRLLQAIGFVKDDDRGVLELSVEDRDLDLITQTHQKVQAAYQQCLKGAEM